ncbi:hypothetical protein [Kiritimatiella glycovorans]|uniref:Salt-induced outer membrane protein n=1 Tax=Kiritimatiella glycovorans TaxID=1307763 RepID=A0A0G3EDV2_9BACT|nr:hypothetical protein [Kiritimatiella glycovorans]AKJ64636.1 hypothetical protein L21SP4_01388 [Kiritimatiella glycovorans]
MSVRILFCCLWAGLTLPVGAGGPAIETAAGVDSARVFRGLERHDDLLLRAEADAAVRRPNAEYGIRLTTYSGDAAHEIDPAVYVRGVCENLDWEAGWRGYYYDVQRPPALSGFAPARRRAAETSSGTSELYLRGQWNGAFFAVPRASVAMDVDRAGGWYGRAGVLREIEAVDNVMLGLSADLGAGSARHNHWWYHYDVQPGAAGGLTDFEAAVRLSCALSARLSLEGRIAWARRFDAARPDGAGEGAPRDTVWTAVGVRCRF